MDSGIVNSDGMPGFECDPPEPKQSYDEWLDQWEWEEEEW